MREAVTRSDTRRLVHELLAAGRSRAEIARQLGVSKGTVSYHARRLGQTISERCARRYDWSAIQTHHDAGHGMRACMAAFGFSSASWFGAVKRGALVPAPARMGLDELLVDGTPRGRFYLKARLLEEGVKEGRCEICGLARWRERPLTLALHHVNGRPDDNRLENLQLLCPNCHSQTDNFAGRNRRGPSTLPGEECP